MPVEKIKLVEVIKHVEVPVEKIVERIKEVPVEVRHGRDPGLPFPPPS